MVTRIGSKAFSGSSKLFDGTLAAAVVGLAQAHTRRVVASLSDITDNGGGTNDAGGVRLPVAFPAFQAGTGDGVLKAEFEASCGNVRDALAELIAKVNAIRAVAPAFDQLIDNLGAAGTDGTIGAIDDSMVGSDANEALVSRVGANAVFANINARTAQLTHFVNKLRLACGATKIASEIGRSSYSEVFAALSTDTGAAVTGANAAAQATISKTAADAALDVCSDNIKTLSTALNALTADANANAPLSVVVVV